MKSNEFEPGNFVSLRVLIKGQSRVCLTYDIWQNLLFFLLRKISRTARWTRVMVTESVLMASTHSPARVMPATLATIVISVGVLLFLLTYIIYSTSLL